MAEQLKTIQDIAVGDKASFTKTVSEADVYLFAGITGDFNPVHIDAEHARKTFFKERIAHGVLTLGFVSTVIGMTLPGPGTILVAQQVRYTAPVRFGDTITAEVEVVAKDETKNRLRLKTTCRNQRGELVLDGETQVSPYLRK